VNEGFSETCLVVSKLSLRDGEVLPDSDALRAVGISESLRCVQNGSGPMVFPREHGLTGCCAFEVKLGDKLWMKNDAETQAPIDAEGNAVRLSDVSGQGVECIPESTQGILA
jgi:hypothetical protein